MALHGVDLLRQLHELRHAVAVPREFQIFTEVRIRHASSADDQSAVIFVGGCVKVSHRFREGLGLIHLADA